MRRKRNAPEEGGRCWGRGGALWSEASAQAGGADLTPMGGWCQVGGESSPHWTVLRACLQTGHLGKHKAVLTPEAAFEEQRSHRLQVVQTGLLSSSLGAPVWPSSSDLHAISSAGLCLVYTTPPPGSTSRDLCLGFWYCLSAHSYF